MERNSEERNQNKKQKINHYSCKTQGTQTEDRRTVIFRTAVERKTVPIARVAPWAPDPVPHPRAPDRVLHLWAPDPVPHPRAPDPVITEEQVVRGATNLRALLSLLRERRRAEAAERRRNRRAPSPPVVFRDPPRSPSPDLIEIKD